jgi:hypothetical protein
MLVKGSRQLGFLGHRLIAIPRLGWMGDCYPRSTPAPSPPHRRRCSAGRGAADTLGRLLRRARGRICAAIGMRDPQSRIGVALKVLSPPRMLPILAHETTQRRGPPFWMNPRSRFQAREDPSVGRLMGHPWPASTARASDRDRSGADIVVILGIDHRDSSHILPDTSVRSLGLCRHDLTMSETSTTQQMRPPHAIGTIALLVPGRLSWPPLIGQAVVAWTAAGRGPRSLAL